MRSTCGSATFLFIFGSLLILLVHSKPVQVPLVRDNVVADVKIGIQTEITEPAFDFKKVYKREVLEKVNDSYIPYKMCRSNRAEVELDIDDSLNFE